MIAVFGVAKSETFEFFLPISAVPIYSCVIVVELLTKEQPQQEEARGEVRVARCRWQQLLLHSANGVEVR